MSRLYLGLRYLMPNSASIATSPVSSQSERFKKEEKRQLASSLRKAERGVDTALWKEKVVRDK